MQRLESDEMLDFVKASLGYHEIRVRRDEGIVFIQSYCLIIPVLVISFDLNIFLKHTCTSGCCSLHCSFGFVCILGRFRYWKVNGMCVCVHVCVAHLSVIHICSHTNSHIHTHTYTHGTTQPLPNIEVSDASFKEGHISTFQVHVLIYTCKHSVKKVWQRLAEYCSN